MTNRNRDIEEEEILESYERDEWRSVSRLQQEIQRYQQIASAWLEANRLVSLALSASDFALLRRKADEAGVSYQEVVASLVHQFVSGKIKVTV